MPQADKILYVHWSFISIPHPSCPLSIHRKWLQEHPERIQYQNKNLPISTAYWLVSRGISIICVDSSPSCVRKWGYQAISIAFCSAFTLMSDT